MAAGGRRGILVWILVLRGIQTNLNILGDCGHYDNYIPGDHSQKHIKNLLSFRSFALNLYGTCRERNQVEHKKFYAVMQSYFILQHHFFVEMGSSLESSFLIENVAYVNKLI